MRAAQGLKIEAAFEVRGKDSGVVRFSYEMLETLKEVVEEEQAGSSE